MDLNTIVQDSILVLDLLFDETIECQLEGEQCSKYRD